MGYTRKDRMMNGMFSRSSKQYADRLERNFLKVCFGIGASLLSPLFSNSKDIAHSLPRANTNSPSKVVQTPLATQKINGSEPYENLYNDYVITTGSEGPYTRTWYYIYAKENPKFECVVDCVRMTRIKEDYAGRKLIKQIARGEEIGVRISGYSIFVHPSQKTRRESEIIIDDSLLPQIRDLAYNFYKKKIEFAQYKFDDFRAGDSLFG